MKIKSIKKNFIYNAFYSLLNAITPLVTVPYLARVIGPTGNGIHSYTYSIANYFVIFAMLGIFNYGNRIIAKSRNNKDDLSREFTSLYYLHVIISLLSFITYLLFIVFFTKNYKMYFFLQSIYVFSTIFDINWLFYGLEEFEVTVVRNILLKILTLILIFTIVKSSDDLTKYIIIINGQGFISQIMLFAFLKKNGIRFVRVSKKEIFKHIKPLIVLFIPVIAVSLYKTMDKIMIGNIVNIDEVAFYDYAERIIAIPVSLVTALSTVMMPRISNLSIDSKNDELIKKYITKSMKLMLFISVGICFGLIGIATNFIPLFLGSKYTKVIYLVELLALTAPIVTFANITREQYLIPKNKDKDFIISIILGAVINLLLNIILIYKYNSIGASIATIIAELTVMLYQAYSIKEKLNINLYFKMLMRYVLSAIIMCFVVILLRNLTNYVFINLLIQIISGIVIYAFLNYNYIFELLKELNLKKILSYKK